MSLLENVVANALQNLVGRYFYGVEKNKLKLSVLSGDLVLRNLRVRTDALSSLLLPFKVKWGLVREFRLNVPWKALGRESVRITIDEVLVLVEPIKEWDHTEYLQMARKAKEEKVEAALLLEQKETQLKAASGFMDKLQQRVIDNVSITVRNVHLRYEDDFSNPERPFAAGVTLERLPIKRGYWRATAASLEVRLCNLEEAGVGGTPPAVGNETIWAEHQCAVGYRVAANDATRTNLPPLWPPYLAALCPAALRQLRRELLRRRNRSLPEMRRQRVGIVGSDRHRSRCGRRALRLSAVARRRRRLERQEGGRAASLEAGASCGVPDDKGEQAQHQV